jgi:hypothetical protein
VLVSRDKTVVIFQLLVELTRAKSDRNQLKMFVIYINKRRFSISPLCVKVINLAHWRQLNRHIMATWRNIKERLLYEKLKNIVHFSSFMHAFTSNKFFCFLSYWPARKNIRLNKTDTFSCSWIIKIVIGNGYTTLKPSNKFYIKTLHLTYVLNALYIISPLW